jgi:hypothetical protein
MGSVKIVDSRLGEEGSHSSRSPMALEWIIAVREGQ